MGDDDAAGFAEWAATRQHRLVRAAYLMTGDLQHAEDLVQEALVKVCLRWGRLRQGTPEAYARTIIYRDHVSWWRRRREYPVDQLPEATVTDPDATEADVVTQALLRLPPRQRSVLVLRYFEDLTERETAELLGVSIGTVKRHAHDGLKALRSRAPELGELTSGLEVPHE